jgi:hypothetical protein
MPKKRKGSSKKAPTSRSKKAKPKRKKKAQPKGKRKTKGKGKRRIMTLDKVRTRRRRPKKKAKQWSYKVPTDEEVMEAINKVMSRDHIIRSQTDLQERVTEELKALDPEFTITGERLRRVALEKVGLAIEISGREIEAGRAMSKCPVCRAPLKAQKNVTIYGGTVTLGFKCTKCPYWTGKKRRVPTRYVFFKRKK